MKESAYQVEIPLEWGELWGAKVIRQDLFSEGGNVGDTEGPACLAPRDERDTITVGRAFGRFLRLTSVWCSRSGRLDLKHLVQTTGKLLRDSPLACSRVGDGGEIPIVTHHHCREGSESVVSCEWLLNTACFTCSHRSVHNIMHMHFTTYIESSMSPSCTK